MHRTRYEIRQGVKEKKEAAQLAEARTLRTDGTAMLKFLISVRLRGSNNQHFSVSEPAEETYAYLKVETSLQRILTGMKMTGKDCHQNQLA